jgi:hypothetical protein
MLEQTVPSDSVQKRSNGTPSGVESIRLPYQNNENFLRNLLADGPAIAHSEDEPVNVGLPPAVERDKSFFIALTHEIHQGVVTEMGPRIHVPLFNVVPAL